MLELKNTISMMTSDDYKERFKAEYFQNFIRYQKLQNMTEKWDKGELIFKPTCPRDIYDNQLEAMGKYLRILEKRAELENIDLSLAYLMV